MEEDRFGIVALWGDEGADSQPPGSLDGQGVGQAGSDQGSRVGDAGSASQPFLVVRHENRTWVAELPVQDVLSVGRAKAADVSVQAKSMAEHHADLLMRDGRQHIRPVHARATVFFNGKKLTQEQELTPGDELAFGDVQMVFGLSSTGQSLGRRVLTHQEFIERLWEESSRSMRSGREMTLVMVRAGAGGGGLLAKAALHGLRNGDVVANFAHDELELLLPDTSRGLAQLVVTRILAAAGTPAAAGFAVLPGDEQHPERLIAMARSALFEARRDRGTGSVPPPVVGRDWKRKTGGVWREGTESELGLTARGTRAQGDYVPGPSEVVAESPAMQAVVADLQRVAIEGQVPVILEGDVGTGRRFLATAFHNRAHVGSDKPLVWFPRGPMEPAISSGMSGGGLNGKSAQEAIRDARDGTLVIVEPAELGVDDQTALAKAIGSGVSCRVITVTSRNLAELAMRRQIEEQLAEKLAGEVIEVPSLRQRMEDIIPLARMFLGAMTPVPMAMGLGALARLQSHGWPGNVLEMHNAMERAVLLAGKGEILAEHLPSDVMIQNAGGDGRLREHVDSVERDAIIKALAEANHNQTHAARRLGVSRRALIYKLEKYGLKSPPGTLRRRSSRPAPITGA